MKAWLCTELGAPSKVLSLVDTTLPVPGPGEIQLQVHAAAIGLPDVMMCRGTYEFKPTIPFTAGQEVCIEQAFDISGNDRSIGPALSRYDHFDHGFEPVQPAGSIADEFDLGTAIRGRGSNRLGDGIAAGARQSIQDTVGEQGVAALARQLDGIPGNAIDARDAWVVNASQEVVQHVAEFME